MKILAIETSSIACSVAYLNGDEHVEKHESLPLQHAKKILSFLNEILHSELSTLDALAWGCGPGSFTGLRIAASIIQALGFTHKLPIINVSSLAALAQTAYLARGWKEMLVAVDARMAESYWGIYSINSSGFAELHGAEGRATINQIPFERLKSDYFAVGDSWSIYAQDIKSQQILPPREVDSQIVPKALAVAQLAKVKYEKGEWLQAFDALPTYLRDNIVMLPS